MATFAVDSPHRSELGSDAERYTLTIGSSGMVWRIHQSLPSRSTEFLIRWLRQQLEGLEDCEAPFHWELLTRAAPSPDIVANAIKTGNFGLDMGQYWTSLIGAIHPVEDDEFDGTPNFALANISDEELAVSGLQTDNVYTLDAIKHFSRLNARQLRGSPWIRSSVVGIINNSIMRGYRPVVNLDDDDDSLEIEARLDSDKLLLLHIRGSGIVEGLISSKSSGTQWIDRINADDFLDWLVAQNVQDVSNRQPFR